MKSAPTVSRPELWDSGGCGREMQRAPVSMYVIGEFREPETAMVERRAGVECWWNLVPAPCSWRIALAGLVGFRSSRREGGALTVRRSRPRTAGPA